jgi:hypothetical protein
MSETERNSEFATIAGLILATVHASHPIRINLDENAIMLSMNIAKGTDPLPLFAVSVPETIEGLHESGNVVESEEGSSGQVLAS